MGVARSERPRRSVLLPRTLVLLHGPLRCPYCHEGCRPNGAVACQTCLGRHHASCWDEHGACASCGGLDRLVPEAPQLLRGGLGEEELIELLRQGRRDEVEAYLERCQGYAEEIRERTEDAAAQLAFEELAARLGHLRSFSVVGPRRSPVKSARHALEGLFTRVVAFVAGRPVARSQQA